MYTKKTHLHKRCNKTISIPLSLSVKALVSLHPISYSISSVSGPTILQSTLANLANAAENEHWSAFCVKATSPAAITNTDGCHMQTQRQSCVFHGEVVMMELHFNNVMMCFRQKQ